MACNVKKCKVMRSTKKRKPLVSNYSLDNSFLEEVKEFKDLGVTTTETFNWNTHIDIVSKAKPQLALLSVGCAGLSLYFLFFQTNKMENGKQTEC